MKKLLLLCSLLCVLNIRADEVVSATVANTPLNLLATGKVIENITFTATTAAITTLKVYDAATATTNYIQAAYSSYASYSTNFNVVFTNSAGLLVTNTFAGIYTGPTAVSAVTNQRPRLVTIVVPASSIRSKDVQIQTSLGLTVVSDIAGIVEVTYR